MSSLLVACNLITMKIKNFWTPVWWWGDGEEEGGEGGQRGNKYDGQRPDLGW